MEEFSLSTLLLSKSITVRSAETDISGYLRPGALVNYLIQAAIDSADRMGFGLARLRETQTFWVLSRLTVHMQRPVRWQETLTIETWPKDVDGLHFLRDFRILDVSGTEIGTGLSGWLMVAQSAKRPVKPDQLDLQLFCALKDHDAADRALLERLVPPTGDSDAAVTLEPAYFDFDLNGHVTTTRYIDWMMDTYDFDFHRKKFVQSFCINFIREILPEDGLMLSKWHRSDYDVFAGNSILMGKPSVLAKLTFADHEES